MEKSTAKKIIASYFLLAVCFAIVFYGVLVVIGVDKYPHECISGSKYSFACTIINEVHALVGSIVLGIGYVLLGGFVMRHVLMYMKKIKA